ncbi:MAG TPA: protein kinase, partial [Actinocrinis sp.]|uniref:serine/threonine-protein kinase n=1 Tax=Actinocrinis sp. TaxID=1920516 RepID=UPI002DDCE2F5
MIQTADGAVGSRYRLVRLVGEGGMGRVWHARDETLDRDVALKEFTLPAGIGAAGRTRLADRIKREARLVARLNHPGIVRVYDIVDHGGSPVIVMEYIPGESLAARIRRDGPIPAATAASMAGRLLAALRHAHAAGIVHRDLKPDNILLTENRCVLTDFGIARSLGGAVSTLTAAGTIVGTPDYLAPELLQGQEATAAADLWSLGATLFAAVEGTPPFTGTTIDAQFSSILNDPVPRAQHAGELTALLKALLVKDPAKRATIQSATALIGSNAAQPPDHGPEHSVSAPETAVPQPDRGRAGNGAANNGGSGPNPPVPTAVMAPPVPEPATTKAEAWLPPAPTKVETVLPLAPTMVEVPVPLDPTRVELALPAPPAPPETEAPAEAAAKKARKAKSAPVTPRIPPSSQSPHPQKPRTATARRAPVSVGGVLRLLAFYSTRLGLIAAGVLGGLYAFKPFVLLHNASVCHMTYLNVQCANRGPGQSAVIDGWNNTPLCWAPAAVLMALGLAAFVAILMPPNRSTVLARYAIVLGLACALDLIGRAAQWVLILNGDQSHWPATP